MDSQKRAPWEGRIAKVWAMRAGEHSAPGAAAIAVKIAARSSIAIDTAALTLGASMFFGCLLHALKPWLKSIQPFAQFFDGLHALWNWLASILDSATPRYGF